MGQGRMHDNQITSAGVELPFSLAVDEDRKSYQGVSARAFVRGVDIPTP